MDIYALTHRGKVREQNEDCIYLSQEGYPYLAIVADGMGGHVAGQVASSKAVAFVRKRLEGYDLNAITKEQFKRLVEEASDYILELANQEEAYKDMGTTFTAAIIRENSAILAHIGDSRAYTFSGGALKQVSHDHSYVQFLVDKGYLSEEEAEKSPYRNIITRAVGMEEAEAEAYEVSFEQGESLLLCSDGLTAHLSNYELGLCLQEEYSSERKAKELLEVALLRGGRDNISIIIAKNNEDKMIEGRFELLSTVDEGGTSIVYQAKDQKTGGLVALKMLREELSDQPEYVENFQREAEMLSCLQHKNIQHLVYRGIHQGRRYIATEFIDGESLKRHIEEGTLSLEQNVSVAMQICEALAYLHGKGILHKDLKPSNVLLTAPNRPILLDFGIAQRQDEQAAAAEIENAEVFGTVNYFSPEQAKGEALDNRTDIYSMGVLLYEMLTGHLPFQGEDNLSVALMHLHQPPVPPKEINDQIPESLNRIVLKALSKEREQRYRSIREMQADLQRALRHQDGKYVRIKAAKEPGKATGVQKRASRHAVLTTACVSVAFLAVVGVFFAIFSAMGGSGENRELYMPGLTEKTYEEAKQTLEDLHLLPTFTYESNLEVEKGYVIRQMPEVGAVVEQGEEVFIVVSLGMDKVVPMPEVLGMQEEQALALLDAQGIRNVSVHYVDLPDEQIGVVIAQSPDGDFQVAEGQEVGITVNRPGQQQNKVVPTLIGAQMEQAIDAATEAGFGKVLIYAVNDGQSVGEVIFQSPQAEAQNIASNTIYMTVHQPKNGAMFRGSLKSDIAELNREGLVTATLFFTLDGRDYEFVVFEETFSSEQFFTQKYPGGIDYSLILANRFRGQNCHLNVYLNGVVVYTSDS